MTEPTTTPDPGRIEKVDEGGLRHLVTELKSTELQIGEHTMQALSQPGTVAVLTAVVVGPDGRQRIVSTAMDESLLARIQPLMQDAAAGREEEMPCVGFHCFVRPRDDAPPKTPDAPA